MIDPAETALTVAATVTALSVICGFIVHRLLHRAGRLRRQKRVGWAWLALVSIAVVAWSVYYYFLRASANDALSLFLGIEGITIGLFATFLWTPARRRVVVVAKARNSFTIMIAAGISSRLRQESGWDVQELFPDLAAAETSHGVTEQLGSLAARQADAVVLVAGDVDEHLHLAVLERLRDGVTVVACDARLDDDYFFSHRVYPPRYVGSNFVQGGRDVAGFIRQHAMANDLIVIFCGPAGNRPAVERCRVALYELMLSDLASNVRTVQIKSFAAAEIIEKFQSRVLPLANAAGANARVFIYCGNDENALIVDRSIRLARAVTTAQFLLVGYDGVRDTNATLLIEGGENIVATVDTLPHRLGQSAADLLFAVRTRSLDTDRRSVVINPSLWERT